MHMLCDPQYKKIAVLLCVLLIFACCSCGAQAPASSTVNMQAPASPQPKEETVSPTPENPVQQFFSGFTEAYMPFLQAASQAAREDAHYLPQSLGMDATLQRLQYFFSDLSALQFRAEGVWEGNLLGIFRGSASIRSTAQGYGFRMQIADDERIIGAINGNALEAEWQIGDIIEYDSSLYTDLEDDSDYIPEMPVKLLWEKKRAVRILCGEQYYIAYIQWDNVYSALRIEKNALYCTFDSKEPIAVEKLPQVWASCLFQEGEFKLFDNIS